MELTATATPETEGKGIPTKKVLLWIGIASIVMLFAALTSGYIVRQAEGNWVVFDLPTPFYVSTVIIFLSSITLHMAIRAVKKDQLKAVKINLIITLALGLAFIFTQFLGWSALVKQGVYFVGNPSGSFLYAISGIHIAHLLGGIISLMVVSGKSLMGRYNSKNYLGMSLCATYWHFLDGLWIYLFVFLAIFR
jgi:cytochrome c oxidase subunit 3